jgi:multiple sugar transport system ATP-binding protein
MASCIVQPHRKSFGSTKVIHGIGFDIADGEFMVLVGPPAAASPRSCACWPASRRSPAAYIAIDGKEVNDVESKDRDIAMVFQSYALYRT